MTKLHTSKGEEIPVDADVYELYKDKCWYVMTRGYVAHSFKEKHRKFSTTVKLHRLIMNATPEQVVDHINGNKLDNRRENLRVCTQAENTRNNRTPRKNKTSRFKGVSWYPRGNRWKAQIQVNKQKKHIGYFPSEEEAALAYDEAAERLHGEFASKNFTR